MVLSIVGETRRRKKKKTLPYTKNISICEVELVLSLSYSRSWTASHLKAHASTST